MQDTIEIKLPISGKTVVIRNYTTHRDDKAANSAMYAGVEAKIDSSSQNRSVEDRKKYVNQETSFPLENMDAMQQRYVERLVQSIDGDIDNIPELLDGMRSLDYEAVDSKVSEVVGANSPKARGAKNASNDSSRKK